MAWCPVNYDGGDGIMENHWKIGRRSPPNLNHGDFIKAWVSMGVLPKEVHCSRLLKGPGGVQGEGVFLGNPRDSVWKIGEP